MTHDNPCSVPQRSRLDIGDATPWGRNFEGVCESTREVRPLGLWPHQPDPSVTIDVPKSDRTVLGRAFDSGQGSKQGLGHVINF